jgi:hypothetical protein
MLQTARVPILATVPSPHDHSDYRPYATIGVVVG